MFKTFLACGLFLVVGVESASAQISIQNYTDATNDRFTNDPAFIGAGYDLSGVARTNDNGRWGTLISPNAVLTVQHLRPSVGSTYEFYSGNDPNSTPFEAIVTALRRVGSSDLTIAILDRNVNSSIAVYEFATEEYEGDPPITTINDDGTTSTETFFNVDPNQVSIVGRRALVVGRSPVSSPAPTDQAVGENIVLGYSENVKFFSYNNNDSIIFENDAEGTANFLTYETHVRAGDSGSPTFLIDDTTDELILLGTNSFRLDGEPPSTFESTGVTYTGNLKDEINTILAANAIEPALLGDCNFDDSVDFLDISPFIVALSLGDFLAEADVNQDSMVDFSDIGLFIELLSSN